MSNQGSHFFPVYVIYVTFSAAVSVAFCLNSEDEFRYPSNLRPRLSDESDLMGQGKGQGSGENGGADVCLM